MYFQDQVNFYDDLDRVYVHTHRIKHFERKLYATVLQKGFDQEPDNAQQINTLAIDMKKNHPSYKSYDFVINEDWVDRFMFDYGLFQTGITRQ